MDCERRPAGTRGFSVGPEQYDLWERFQESEFERRREDEAIKAGGGECEVGE